MNNIETYNENIFESIKHYDENSNEFWYARELMPILEYSKWENFNSVIIKAVTSYKNSNNDDSYWLPEVREPIKTGKGKIEYIKDYKLSRYICYLIVQNANPKKKMVALSQTYFAIQTRRMELSELEYGLLSEDEKRLYQRKRIKDGNKLLYKIASEKGVRNFDRFTNAGYKGLYNGETADDIAKRKNLRYREDILDNMGSVELSANIFRISQTEALLEKQKEESEQIATDTHYKVGKAIRKTIKEIGGTMPEELPTPKKSIKDLDNIANNSTIKELLK